MTIVHLMLILITYTSALAIESCNNPKEPVYINISTPTGKTQAPICPAQFENEINKSETDSTSNSILKYCMYQETVPIPEDQTYLCKEEVKPAFYEVTHKNKPVRCSSRKHGFLHQFGYYYCQKMKTKLNEERKEIQDTINNSELTIIDDDTIVRYAMMYEVCYDISKNETLWTKHQVRNIFTDEHTIFDDPYCPEKISTYPYYENSENHFLKLQKEYAIEKENPTSHFPQIPQRLVPSEHFSLRTWKKTTNHYINTAPFCEILVPLMTAIDEGIEIANWRVSLIERDPDKPPRELVIYTRVKSASSFVDNVLKLFTKRDRFEPNIWYKFVYDPVEEQGVMIYVHNTHPLKITKKHKEVECHFEKWTDDESIRKTIISSMLQNYAYCGKVTSKDVKNLYSIDVKIRDKVLDIDFLAS